MAKQEVSGLTAWSHTTRFAGFWNANSAISERGLTSERRRTDPMVAQYLSICASGCRRSGSIHVLHGRSARTDSIRCMNPTLMDRASDGAVN